MSDANLRDLQRRALAGDRDAEARLLGELVRVGRLTPALAQVAALVGRADAAAVLDIEVESPAQRWKWISAVVEADVGAGQRALLAACASVRPVWEAAHPGDERFTLVESLAGQSLAGDAKTRASLADRLEAALSALPLVSPVSSPPNRAARVPRSLGLSLLAPSGAKSNTLDGLRYAHLTASGPGLREAISSALRTWIDETIRV